MTRPWRARRTAARMRAAITRRRTRMAKPKIDELVKGNGPEAVRGKTV